MPKSLRIYGHFATLVHRSSQLRQTVTSYPGHMSPMGGAISVSVALSLYCKTMDTGLVHRVMCLFTSQPKLVLIYRPWRKAKSTKISYIS